MTTKKEIKLFLFVDNIIVYINTQGKQMKKLKQ